MIVNEVNRTLDLNRFLLHFYWADRDAGRFLATLARHAHLLWIRSRVGAR